MTRFCVLLGLRNLLLLRLHPSQENQFEVVGQANMHGLMYGEGLLGPVPEPYEAAWTTGPSSGKLYFGFLNRETKEWQVDDPRLGPLPDDWTKIVHETSQQWNVYLNKDTEERESRFDPRMTAEELTKRGVELEEFHLI